MTLSQSTATATEVVERMLHEGFEAGNADIVDELCAPDMIEHQFTGTHTGPFIGPATGNPVHFTVIDVATVRDGRIVEHWGVPDRFAILAQTDQLPRPA